MTEELATLRSRSMSQPVAENRVPRAAHSRPDPARQFAAKNSERAKLEFMEFVHPVGAVTKPLIFHFRSANRRNSSRMALRVFVLFAAETNELSDARSYEYDVNGQMTSADDDNSSYDYTYDKPTI